MIEFVTDRMLITATVLKLIKSDYTPEDLERVRVTWWKNVRPSGGFGLTFDGDQAFRQADLEHWDFDAGIVDNSLSAMSFAVAVDKKMPVPYYLYFSKRHKYLRIYDSRVAMLMGLYGNVSEYLTTLKAKR
jgi:hypothetical protein